MVIELFLVGGPMDGVRIKYQTESLFLPDRLDHYPGRYDRAYSPDRAVGLHTADGAATYKWVPMVASMATPPDPAP